MLGDDYCADSGCGPQTIDESTHEHRQKIESRDGSQMILQSVHLHLPVDGTAVSADNVSVLKLWTPFSYRVRDCLAGMRDALLCGLLTAVMFVGLQSRGCIPAAHGQQPGCSGGQCQPPSQGPAYLGPHQQNPIGEANFAPQTAHPASCRVRIPAPGATYYGSGVLVDVDETTGLVITNNHVVNEGQGQGTCTFPGGEVLPCRVVAVDRVWDLAALEISKPTAQPVQISDRTPKMGDVLTAMGYGSKGQFRAVSGPVCGYKGPGDGPGVGLNRWLGIQAAVRQGDSGGPMLSEDGRLAALLWGCDGHETLGTYCVQLKAFVAPIRPNCQNQQPRPQPPAVQQKPSPPLVTLPPVQTNPPPSQNNCKCDPTQIAALQVRVTHLEELAVQLNTFLKNPPPGQVGPAGPRGEPGPMGPAGKDGAGGSAVTAAQLDQQIKNAIAGKLRIVVERTK
jgi:hypothetical protein